MLLLAVVVSSLDGFFLDPQHGRREASQAPHHFERLPIVPGHDIHADTLSITGLGHVGRNGVEALRPGRLDLRLDALDGLVELRLRP